MAGQSPEEVKVWHWAQKLGGLGWDIPNGIVTDSKNNVYVGGAFVGEIKGGGTQLQSNGNKDLYLAKLKDSGKFEWVKTFGGVGYDKLTCMAISDKDEIYIGGVMTGEVNFGKKKHIDFGKNGLFVACFDTKGNCRWVCPIACSKMAAGHVIDIDDSGDICFGGAYTDSISAGEFKQASKGKTDIFWVTISSEGTVKNITALGGKGKETLNALASFGDGEYLCAGSFDQPFIELENSFVVGTEGYKNTYLMSTGSGESARWAKTWSSPSYCEVKGARPTNDRGAFLCGNFSGSLLFDSVTVKSNGAVDFFVTELDSTGKVVWFRHFGSKFNDHASGMVCNRVGGVMVTGTFCDSLKLEPYVVAAAKGATATFAMQLDRDGNVLWAGKIGGEKGHSFGTCSTIDRDGNLILAGNFNHVFDSPSGVQESAGGEDVYVARYANCEKPDTLIMGVPYVCPGATVSLFVDKKYSNAVWNDTVFGKRLIEIDRPGSYQVRVHDGAGCIYRDTVSVQLAPVVGYSIGQDTSLVIGASLVLEGPDGMARYVWQGIAGERNYVASDENGEAGPKTFVLETVDEFGCIDGDTIVVDFYNRPLSLGSLANEKSLKVYPNPVREMIHWRLDIDGETMFDLEISDLTGNVQTRRRIQRYMPREEMEENLASLLPGTYVLRVIGEGLTISNVFIKK
ncbi:MAG: T9SS type A sorting domain-containing protein [Breznakibacter sp.]